MRYDRIEQFIMEGGDLDELIIDQEPLHDADHTFSYYYLRKGDYGDFRKTNNNFLANRSDYWRRCNWAIIYGKEISYE